MSCHLSAHRNQSPAPGKPEIEKPANPPEVVPEKQKENPVPPGPEVLPAPEPEKETTRAPEIHPQHDLNTPSSQTQNPFP